MPALTREARIVRTLRGAGFKVLTRRQWGSEHRALYQWRRVNRHFSGKAKAMFAHVTVTNPSGDFAQDVRVVENIGYDRFKTGISYNYCVDQRTGAIAIGMPHDAAGAHTLNDKGISGFPENLNYYGHAIAWIANVGDTPSQRCLDAYAAIMAAEKKHGAAQSDAPIYPHSKFAWKDCPLESLRKHLDAILGKSRTILEKDWSDMATKAEIAEVVENKVAPLRKDLASFRTAFAKFREVLWKRDKALAGELRAIAAKQADQATQERLNAVAADLSNQIDTDDLT